jgi:hypothetical protein
MAKISVEELDTATHASRSRFDESSISVEKFYNIFFLQLKKKLHPKTNGNNTFDNII